MFSRYIAIGLILTVILATMPCLADQNVLVNPGFEDNTTGWSGRSCSIEAVSEPVHGGTASVKAFGRDQNWQGVRQSVLDKLVPGETYQVSGWVRLEGDASDTIQVSFEKQDDAGVNYINVAGKKASGSDWVELAGQFKYEPDGDVTLLDLYFEGPAAGVNFFVDDVNVYGKAAEPKQAQVKKAGSDKAKVTINAGEKRQEIEGFGASGAHFTMEFVQHNKKDELYKLLFKDLDLDIFRIKNYHVHGLEPNSFSETAEVARGGKAAMGGDLKIMISSWSPPAELKSNDSIRGGGTLKKKDGKYVYDEFAQWWLESLMAYKAAGVDVDYVNIQNEPDYTAQWDSCLLEPTETNEIAGYDAAFEAVWQKLNKEMGKDMPKMLVADSSGLDRIDEYIDNIDDLSHVYGYAHHLYNCFGDGDDIPGCGAAPDRYITRMDEFRTDYGNKPRIQTEYEHEADTWEDAINSAITIHNFLTVEEGSAYLYWELFWGPTSGLVSIMDPNTVRINPVYYTFKNYSAYISSGWKRVQAENDNDDLKVSAYVSQDGKKATVVIINTSKDTEITAQLGLDGFEASGGEIYRSSETEKCEPVGKYESGAELKLPAYSVTTIVF